MLKMTTGNPAFRRTMLGMIAEKIWSSGNPSMAVHFEPRGKVNPKADAESFLALLGFVPDPDSDLEIQVGAGEGEKATSTTIKLEAWQALSVGEMSSAVANAEMQPATKDEIPHMATAFVAGGNILITHIAEGSRANKSVIDWARDVALESGPKKLAREYEEAAQGEQKSLWSRLLDSVTGGDGDEPGGDGKQPDGDGEQPDGDGKETGNDGSKETGNGDGKGKRKGPAG